MPQLITPDARLRASYTAALEEFRAEGRGGPDDGSSLGRALREWSARWHEPEVFGRYVARLLSTPGCTTLWYAEDTTYLGRLAVRHTLADDVLRIYGGHIGYDVRPSARRSGHATAMLRAALPVAASLGIDPVLVTCDTVNTASRKVIESCGGVREGFADATGAKLRYWVSTARHDAA